jgi:hypothetical protein
MNKKDKTDQSKYQQISLLNSFTLNINTIKNQNIAQNNEKL